MFSLSLSPPAEQTPEKITTMCHKQIVEHSYCKHTSEETVHCRPWEQYSAIIPKSCLPNFKLTDPNNKKIRKGKCFDCSMDKEKYHRVAQELQESKEVEERKRKEADAQKANELKKEKDQETEGSGTAKKNCALG